jgi:hypothetical protein
VITQNTYHVDKVNRSYDQNQVFTAYKYGEGNYTKLYYSVRMKGCYTETWTYAPEPKYYGLHNALDSDHTLITLSLSDFGFWAFLHDGRSVCRWRHF